MSMVFGVWLLSRTVRMGAVCHCFFLPIAQAIYGYTGLDPFHLLAGTQSPSTFMFKFVLGPSVFNSSVILRSGTTRCYGNSMLRLLSQAVSHRLPHIFTMVSAMGQ